MSLPVWGAPRVSLNVVSGYVRVTAALCGIRFSPQPCRTPRSLDL